MILQRLECRVGWALEMCICLPLSPLHILSQWGHLTFSSVLVESVLKWVIISEWVSSLFFVGLWDVSENTGTVSCELHSELLFVFKKKIKFGIVSINFEPLDVEVSDADNWA